MDGCVCLMNGERSATGCVKPQGCESCEPLCVCFDDDSPLLEQSKDEDKTRLGESRIEDKMIRASSLLSTLAGGLSICECECDGCPHVYPPIFNTEAHCPPKSRGALFSRHGSRLGRGERVFFTSQPFRSVSHATSTVDYNMVIYL